MSTYVSAKGTPMRRHRRRGVAAIVTFLLAFASFIVPLGGAAYAATPGITSNLLLNGASYDGVRVVNEGDVLTLKVQYDNTVAPGSTVVFDFGSNVSVQSNGVPPGNTVIQSIKTVGNRIEVTFKDPWPSNVNQGAFDLSFKVNDVERSGKDQLSWRIDGEENAVDVIIKNNGDNFENVTESFAKSVSPGNLNSYVKVVDGVVELDPSLLERDLDYTLTVNSPKARVDFPISDTLPKGLVFVAGSFSAKVVTWDADGLNRQEDVFPFVPTIAGDTQNQTMTNTVNLPGADARDADGASVLTVRYKARFANQNALDLARDNLQASHDALGNKPGDFSLPFTNKALFGDVEKSATVKLQGTIAAPPGPQPDKAFAKSVSPERVNVLAADEKGVLAPPADVTYALRADLSKLKGASDYAFDRNIVIKDTLPAHTTWNTASPEFFTASAGSYTAVATCSDAAAFAADAYVGKYCISGQDLFINVGKNASTNVLFHVKAQIVNVTGLTAGNDSTIQDARSYKVGNTAQFFYREASPFEARRDVTVIVPPKSDGSGLNDSSVFTKRGVADESVIEPGQSAKVRYAFHVAAGKGIDASKSSIVDHIDAEIFDLADQSAREISGSYDGKPLTADDFVVVVKDQELVIALSASGKAVVADRGVDKEFSVSLILTTKPFDGKATKAIKNTATLVGDDGKPLYWSATGSEVTSYGDEAEVRKRVYDRDSAEWVETLKAVTGVDGKLIQDSYVYRVEFIPHGSYNNVTIVPVVDLLPSALEFLGFVSEDDAATAKNPTAGPVEIGGNLEASFTDGTVTIRQKNGSLLEAGAPIAAYFAVRVLDQSAPIVNRIGTTEATIEPQDPPSIDIEKWSDEGENAGPSYDDAGRLSNDGYPGDFDSAPGKRLEVGATQDIRFTISNDGGEALKDIVVSDRLAEGEGEITDLSCVFPDETKGTEWAGPLAPGERFECTGTIPGLPAGAQHSDTAAVSATGVTSGDEVTDEDRWNGHTVSYAIGDYTWIDSNRDGIQDEDEPRLTGVSVELLNEDGTILAKTKTDEEGRYLFDGLAAGTYRVRFTLTEEQAARYRFTTPNAGGSSAKDSDAIADGVVGLTKLFVLDDDNAALTRDYDREITATQGIDPTWDAGVVLKSVSVGDFVWVDANRDGRQDAGEPGIPGVVLVLTGPDGKPVTDVFGAQVPPVTTDQDGHYTFDNLPALSGEEKYVVRIDREKSAEALKPYVPTISDQGDRAGDSSLWEAETLPGELSNDGDRDPTLDFGFVTKTYAIGDVVWIDTNKNGIQEEGEKPLAGVTVELLNTSEETISTTTTDADGRYAFDSLPAGEYLVRFTLTPEQRALYTFTTQNAGEDSGSDSDADIKSGLTAVIVLDDSNTALTSSYEYRNILASEGIDPTWDAGVILIDTVVPTPEPTDDPTVTPTDDPEPEPGEEPGQELPRTGAELSGGVLAAAVLFIVMGLGLFATRRRKVEA